jgi:hypothetical protein
MWNLTKKSGKGWEGKGREKEILKPTSKDLQ